MLNSTVLEVAIGLVFCYASVALISSSVYEAIASWLNLRSKTLLSGIARILNATDREAGSKELLQKIYNNALVHPSGDGNATNIDTDKSIPAYIPSKNFALALMHAIQQSPDNFENLKADILAVKDEQLRNLLRGLERKAGGNLEAFEREVADWFDASMERVSGLYKKKSQLWCFFIALLISIIFNIDSVHLFKTLWLHPSLVAQVSAEKLNPELASAAYQQLQMLPVGWNQAFEWRALLSPSLWLGWLLTASASLFGAPFWFDTLKTLVRLRGTGLKPSTEKATREASGK